MDFYNRKFLFLLSALNFIGLVSALYLYIPDIRMHIAKGKYFIILFFVVSVWLYLSAFIFSTYLYLDKKIPKFLGGLCFIYSFVYGFGSFIFYPLLMIFVSGFTPYYFWNVFAHGFVGLQSFLFLERVNRPGFVSSLFLIFVFLLKDLADFFYGGFLYFGEYEFPYFFKIFLMAFIVVLQIIGFYLMLKPQKT